MNKRIWLIMVLVAAALAGVAFFARSSREPAYRDRPLSEWLQGLNVNDPGVKARTEDALHHMGRDAAPILIEMLCSPRDSRLKHQMLVLFRKQSAVKLPLMSSAERKDLAFRGLVAVGPESLRPQVPVLAKHLRAGRVEAARILAVTGTNGIPALIEALANQTTEVRSAAADALGLFGRAKHGSVSLSLDKFYDSAELRSVARAYGEASVPVLIAWIKDGDSRQRRAALGVLPDIGENPEQTVPIALEQLRQPEAYGRFCAIRMLTNFPQSAQAATPFLVNALADPNKEIRQAATNAFKMIDPEAAAQAGVN